MTKYKIMVAFTSGEKVTTTVDGRDALRDFLVKSGVRVTSSTLTGCGEWSVEQPSHFSSIESVRFVALGWQISGHGGTLRQRLNRISPEPRVLGTPAEFRKAADGSAEYTRKDGSTGRASFWAHAPTNGQVWAVDVVERRYVRLSADMREMTP
ncbi:MAG TPA: hypothetical protein VK878_23305 [Candidatus Deferrimicrobiaceae bacterium]|nr:hypothetical protein [Candidatus Deferrimicrobiaceae bacterium]